MLDPPDAAWRHSVMSDPAGKWNIVLQTPFGEKSARLELILSEQGGLTGSLAHGDYRAAITHGKLQGRTLSWTAELRQPMKLNLKFTATIEADRIQGAARHLLGSATFTGNRA